MLQSPEKYLQEQLQIQSQKATKILKDTRKTVPPEREYLLGLLMVYTYVITLYRPELLPTENLQNLAAMLHEMSSGDLALLTGIFLGLLLSFDGATRIVLEKLPFFKAYCSVFLLRQDN